MKRGRFIVLEGPDKSGKSTQAGLLASALRAEGRKVVHTREPGGTAFAEAIRKVLLDPAHRIAPLAELLLYEAARAQHTEELLKPALKRGAVVVCERYTLASLAYQGHARGLGTALVRRLTAVATGGLKADLCLVLDIPDRAFISRDPRRARDRLELESSRFRALVREGYRRLARAEPRTALIDASGERGALHQEILSRVGKIL